MRKDKSAVAVEASTPEVDPWKLQTIFAEHLSIYRRKVPYYQATMLSSLRELWRHRYHRLLDIGGGTGVVAEAMAQIFPVNEVLTIDLVDRFCRTLSVRTVHYDGKRIPFADNYFDAATLNNVIHHVPVVARVRFLREIRRSVVGPLYIKDHECQGPIDHFRLAALDAIGNIPFGGMLEASYLTPVDWLDLAGAAGYRIAARAAQRRYRAGLCATIFPNRLEVAMRFDPV